MSPQLALIRELDVKIDQISAQQRGFVLRRLTDLFLVNEGHYSSDEIELIDELFVRLVETIEESARALLGIRLAPIASAPPRVLRLLACDDAIEVASPVLTQSEALDEETLIACSRTKSPDHLFAISQRKTMSENLTEILVQRGDQQVLLNTVRNIGARFSETGFGILVKRAQGNDELAGFVGARPDLPRALFESLLAEASDLVRAKLKAERRHDAIVVDHAVSDISAQLRSGADAKRADWIAAQTAVYSLYKTGKLDAAMVSEWAAVGSFEKLAASLALMANKPIDVVATLLRDSTVEMTLVLAKAVGLPWEEAWTVASSMRSDRSFAPADIEKSQSTYRRMMRSTADKILDFYCRRNGKDFLVH
jgi:uncharacterized protein (DUF2336 family)